MFRIRSGFNGFNTDPDLGRLTDGIYAGPEFGFHVTHSLNFSLFFTKAGNKFRTPTGTYRTTGT